MNEQIKLLAEQAGIITNLESNFFDKDPNKWVDYFSEKFAELIIQECADICNKIYFDRYPDAEDFERSEEGDAIKNHFGVEL